MNDDERTELRAIRDGAVAVVRDLRGIADAYRAGPECEAARAIAEELDGVVAEAADPLLADERPAESAPVSDPAANPRPRARAVRDELGRLAAAAHDLANRLDASQDQAYGDVVTVDGALYAALRHVNTRIVHDGRDEGLRE